MNVNGSNKDCSGCPAAVKLGVNSLGMELYGCKYKVAGCRDGKTLFEQMEQAKKNKDRE